MKVVLFAHTMLTTGAFEVMDDVGYESNFGSSELDELGEFAGRSCFLSYNRPNSATAKNEDYLGNILEQDHTSIFEHASATFYVTGVSRALLLELERHRHISFSVLSTRYVDADKFGTTIHPLFPEDLLSEFHDLDRQARHLYKVIYDKMRENGYSVKQARGVARSALLEATETRYLVTGNIRAWRDIIKKRYHPAAEEEIIHFAGEVLNHLKTLAPNSVQDIS